ncbi:MAG: hypothetical protein ABR968_02455 [Bacteroidales bacterium]|jgi:hypothetical protein
MKKYFKILVIATFTMLFVAKSYSQNTSNATSPQQQPKKTVEQRTTSMVDEMTKAAALTSDEVSKITPFVTEFQKQKDADQEANKDNKEKLSSARKARIDKLSAQVKNIVTPDQYVKLQDYLKNKQNNRGNNNKPAINKD